MSASIRVFALLGDEGLQQRLQQDWRSNGITLCPPQREGTASLSEELARLRPQVVVADAELEGVRELVQTATGRFRIPTLCIVRPQLHGLAALRPLEWGAVDLLEHPETDTALFVRQLEEGIHTAGRAQVVEQLESIYPLSGAFPDASVFDLRGALRRLPATDKLIVVAAGPGGPMGMRRILTTLRRQTWSPIVYVQRLPPRLRGTLAQWLEKHTGATVRRAVHGQSLEIGHVYLAGDDESLRVTSAGSGGAALQVESERGDGKPLDALLRSVARSFGAGAVGVLLSGTGGDGCEGLLALRAAGALTIIQDRDSSLLYELPGRARDAGGAIECLPINEIAERLSMLMQPLQVTEA